MHKEAWLRQLLFLTEAVDGAIELDDFLAVSGGDWGWGLLLGLGCCCWDVVVGDVVVGVVGVGVYNKRLSVGVVVGLR